MAQAHGEAEIQPHGAAYDLRLDAMRLEGNGLYDPPFQTGKFGIWK